MKIHFEKKAIIATTYNEQHFLKLMFNQNLIRGAYLFWNGKGDIPDQTMRDFEPNVTGYMVLTDLEDPRKHVNQFESVILDSQKQKEEVVKQVEQERVGDLFNFMENGKD